MWPLAAIALATGHYPVWRTVGSGWLWYRYRYRYGGCRGMWLAQHPWSAKVWRLCDIWNQFAQQSNFQFSISMFHCYCLFAVVAMAATVVVRSVAGVAAGFAAGVFINLLVLLMANRCVYMSISNLVCGTLSAWIYSMCVSFYRWVRGCLGAWVLLQFAKTCIFNWLPQSGRPYITDVSVSRSRAAN